MSKWIDNEKSKSASFEDIRFNDFDAAWKVWAQMQATDWRFLPFEGGLLDQPEALMNDVLAISGAYANVKRSKDNPNQW